jgi:hypothetical protein
MDGIQTSPGSKGSDPLNPYQSFRVEETSSTYYGYQLDGTTLYECVKQRFAKYEQHVLVALELFKNIDTLGEQAYGLSNMERRDIKSYLGRPLPTNETVQESQKSKIKCLFTEASRGRNENDPPSEQVQSRAFTKLCYIADPRYESGASVLGVSPRAIASVRSEN